MIARLERRQVCRFFRSDDMMELKRALRHVGTLHHWHGHIASKALNPTVHSILSSCFRRGATLEFGGVEAGPSSAVQAANTKTITNPNT